MVVVVMLVMVGVGEREVELVSEVLTSSLGFQRVKERKKQQGGQGEKETQREKKRDSTY